MIAREEADSLLLTAVGNVYKRHASKENSIGAWCLLYQAVEEGILTRQEAEWWLGKADMSVLDDLIGDNPS